MLAVERRTAIAEVLWQDNNIGKYPVKVSMYKSFGKLHGFEKDSGSALQYTGPCSSYHCLVQESYVTVKLAVDYVSWLTPSYWRLALKGNQKSLCIAGFPDLFWNGYIQPEHCSTVHVYSLEKLGDLVSRPMNICWESFLSKFCLPNYLSLPEIII